MADLAIFGMGVERAAHHPSNRRRFEGRRVPRVADGTNDSAPRTPDPITEAPLAPRGILAAMLVEPIALPTENVARRDALVPGLT